MAQAPCTENGRQNLTRRLGGLMQPFFGQGFFALPIFNQIIGRAEKSLSQKTLDYSIANEPTPRSSRNWVDEQFPRITLCRKKAAGTKTGGLVV